MPGPAPKFPEVRRNTSQKAQGEWVDLVVPKLSEPAHPSLQEISKTVSENLFVQKEWLAQWNADDFLRWDTWRSDPAAAYWSDADVDFAIETLLCYHPAAVGVKKDGEIVYGGPAWPQITSRRDRLGLTPKGKRDLRYRILFAPYGRDKTLDVGDEDQLSENVVMLDSRRAEIAG